MLAHGSISRLSIVLLLRYAQGVVSSDFKIHAINPTVSGQIGINPVSAYGITTAAAANAPIVTTTVVFPTATRTVVAPWAVVTEASGDIAFPATEDGKAALQSMFDQVTAACAGKTKLKRTAVFKRSGSCELQQFQNLAHGGGPLDFDIPGIEISIPTFTAGDVAVALQGGPAAVAVAFIAYVIGNGKSSDSVAPKVAASQIIKTAGKPTSAASTKSAVPTADPDDQLDSLYTAADAVYQSIAQVILAQITADASADSVLWGSAPTAVPIPRARCDRTTLIGMETISFFSLVGISCLAHRQLGKDWKFVDEQGSNVLELEWKSKGDCGGTTCLDLFGRFATDCAYNRHSVYKSGTIDLTCGSASYEIISLARASTSTTSVAPAASQRPKVSDSCADTKKYTKFTRSQALDAIKDFCGHDINLPNAGLPVWKTYKDKDVTLQLDVRWSTAGQDGCNAPTKLDSHLSGDDCSTYFQSAVDNCNTDTTDNKFGQTPLVWNSPNGCIDFEIYGNGADWDCSGLGQQPLQCVGPPNNGIQLP